MFQKNLAKFWLLITLAFTLSFPFQTIVAAGNLELARDTVSTSLPDVPNLPHEAYFVLPADATQVKNTDWIVIDLPFYPLLDISTAFVVGGYGDAVISKSGTQVRVTGVALLPGSAITITGFTATNPAEHDSNRVFFYVGPNADGSSPRNSAIVIPSDSKNSVSVSAVIQSPLCALTITGFTSPNAFVTVTENATVIGTTVANSYGEFTVNLTAIDPGAHSYQLFATDSSNRGTAQTSLNVYLVGGTLSTASGLILSSTLALSRTVIDAGDSIIFSGSAKPSSQINIFVESPLRNFTATTDTSGNWSYTLAGSETLTYTPGEYRVYTVVQDSLGNQSIVSNTLVFTVNSPSDPDNPNPACDISHGDLNCNGVTNLTDFSILLYHWNTNHKVADINADGSVNLVDFSIMMFYYVQ